LTALVGQLTVAAFSSCSKDEDNKNSKSIPGVYVAGGSFIWKDGEVLYRLGDTTGITYSAARSVFVSGSDVYAAGEGGKMGDDAILWKNGVEQVLNDRDSHASANSVYVSGNDVYVAGSYQKNTSKDDVQVAVVWKNGVMRMLTDGKHTAGANSVYVSGSDVYVAGFLGPPDVGGYYEPAPGSNSTATVWKNGVAQALTVGEAAGANANSVYVSGNDVYVAGCDGGKAKIWKNGKEMLTSSLNSFSEASSIFVQGSDVYAIIVENWKTCLWKNGVVTELTGITSGISGKASSLYVSGNDVYVVADYKYPETFRYSAMVWKNGEITILPGNFAYSIFVVD
jgi:hypothetical protein